MNKLFVLVVEDDKSVRNLIVTTLRTHGYRYAEAPTGEAAIVQASSHNPDVILLDEPTASLDPENVTRLEEILDRLTQAGIALLVSTHDVDFAARFARRGLVFNRGKLAKDASM